MNSTPSTPFRPWFVALSCAVAAAAMTSCGGGEPAPNSTTAQGATASDSASGTIAPSGSHAPGVTVDPSATVPNNAEPTGVDVRRRGGIGGVDDRLVMDDNGKVTMTSRTAPVKLCTIDPAFVEKLSKLAETKGGSAKIKPEHPDQMLVTISYHGKSVKAAPPAVDQATADRLVKILDAAASKDTGKSGMCP